jgi:ABC-type antimicrobial peptide transport system permease subunit
MEDLFSRSFADRQFSLLLLGTFAAIALTLAAIGIYGTIGFTVRQRRQEIGVRTALGASRYRILTMVISEGLLLTLFGVVLGAIGASALTTFMQGLLFDIRPTDTLTFAGVIVLLVLVALFASIVPARHATKVDPVVALRSQ